MPQLEVGQPAGGDIGPLWTPAEAAPVLGFKLHRVYDLVELGLLPHYRIGGRIYLTPKLLRQFLDACKREGVLA